MTRRRLRTLWMALLLSLSPLVHAAHTETVQPVGDGPYPVGSSTLVADDTAVAAMLAAGRDAGQYIGGGDTGSELLYLDTLVTDEGSTFRFQVNVPDNATLYGGQAGATLTYVGLLLYPSSGQASDAEFFTATLPGMHRSESAIPFADLAERYPLLIASHGTGGDAVNPTELERSRWFASHGYVVLALFHGDNRFSTTSAERLTLRPLAVSAAIDALMEDPWFGDHIDFDRIGGIGSSYGGTTLLALLGGRVVLPNVGSTFDFTPTATVTDDRILAAATLVPYTGAPLGFFDFEQFGTGGSGAAYIQRPVLANAGTADDTADYSMTQSVFQQIQGTRYLVSYPGEGHGFSDPAVTDAHNWMLLFMEAHVKGDADALTRLQGAADFAGNASEELTVAVDVETSGDEATFANGQLLLPWVEVGGQYFSATLALTNVNPLEFQLTGAAPATGQPVNATTFQGGTLSIPRVGVGGAHYQVTLQLVAGSPPTFRLAGAAPAQ